MNNGGAGGTSIGSTLTGGIQDVSALLPLLGTGQCEEHISSALTKGYIYVAVTPMSIFGTLGMTVAGFKALIASLSLPSWNFVGALKLYDAGFDPTGTNLSLIMLDKNNKDRYLVETRLISFLESLHIDNAAGLSVRMDCFRWNTQMFALTAALCVVGVTPYVHLNIRGNSTLPASTRWAFPVIRVFGGFLTATMIQLVIQSRLLSLLNKRLFFMALRGAIEEIEREAEKHSKWKYYTALEPRLWMFNACVRERLMSITRKEREYHS